ncbi:MAG: hypothetical protein LIO77_03420 [Rikenellaceae bacterium]|nr:hypothetical protein [Rikenellaceae bacterium]
MKTNRLNKRYSEISSLKELELERDRLHYKMGLREVELKRHMEDIKQSLTFSNVCRTVWSRIQGPTIAMGWAQGLNLFSWLFGRKRKKHSCSL